MKFGLMAFRDRKERAKAEREERRLLFGAEIREGGDNVEMSILASIIESGVFGACCGIQVCAALDEKGHHFKVANEGGGHERRIAVGIALVYVGARGQEDFHDGLTGLERLGRVTTRSTEERRTSIETIAYYRAIIGVGLGGEKGLNDSGAPVIRGDTEWRCAGGGHIRGPNLLEQPLNFL